MTRKSTLLWLCLALTACSVSRSHPAHESRLKLIVLVVFDQMRADYLTRWSEHFGDGGFRRITRGGATYSNCQYPYANTLTGPGHATMATGCAPDQHGIIANEWYDRAAGKKVHCATNERSLASPERLLVPTFADALKSPRDNRSKVVALSHKSRSACLVAGRNPDACYWLDAKAGSFVTSTYYRDGVHGWVAAFNERKRADQLIAQTWNRLRTDLDYVRLAGPDDVPSERPGIHRRQGRVFPHAFSRQVIEKDEQPFDELLCSPMGNELLLEFAKAAIPAMELGRDDRVDFLSVSFSCNDVVGHCFGPDSQEVCDLTLRSDDLLARLLTYLDQEVGAGNYVLALSADHGVCQLPEVAARVHPGAQRVDPTVIRDLGTKYLNERFGPVENETGWIEEFEYPWVYLNYRTLGKRGLSVREVEAALASCYRRQEWAADVVTRNELTFHAQDDRSPAGKMQRSCHPERSGDIALVLKPYQLCIGKSEGTTHGSPYSYDTSVPLIFYGRGIAPRQMSAVVSPQAIAGLFARVAGITMALPADATPPELIATTSGLESN